jgi:hypothetical protein
MGCEYSCLFVSTRFGKSGTGREKFWTFDLRQDGDGLLRHTAGLANTVLHNELEVGPEFLYPDDLLDPK